MVQKVSTSDWCSPWTQTCPKNQPATQARRLPSIECTACCECTFWGSRNFFINHLPISWWGNVGHAEWVLLYAVHSQCPDVTLLSLRTVIEMYPDDFAARRDSILMFTASVARERNCSNATRHPQLFPRPRYFSNLRKSYFTDFGWMSGPYTYLAQIEWMVWTNHRAVSSESSAEGCYPLSLWWNCWCLCSTWSCKQHSKIICVPHEQHWLF